MRGKAFRGLSAAKLLAALASESVSVAEALESAARRLDLHYVQSRYPNGLGGDPTEYHSADTDRESLGFADRILEFARTLL